MDFGFGPLEDTVKKEEENKKGRQAPSNKNKKGRKMAVKQFVSVDVGSSLAGLDLSRVAKYALVSDKSLFGGKPKIVIYFHDRPETPAMNFELQSDEEAQKIYKRLDDMLNQWAEEANSSKVRRLEREAKAYEKRNEALVEQNKILMNVFESFKEMMHIMEDETKVSELVTSIKDM